MPSELVKVSFATHPTSWMGKDKTIP